MLIEMELNEVIDYSEKINVFKNGETVTYVKGESPYCQIIDGWRSLTENVHEMPAYGVSLNNETIKAMKNGLWVEFVFDKQFWHNEMPFERLLVNAEKDWQGFNIIRYTTQEGYSGRCYYFDLINKNMSEFYDILANL